MIMNRPLARKFNILLLLLVVCFSCSSSPPQQETALSLISSRDPSLPPIYRVKAPLSWQKQSIAIASLQDSTKPIAEFHIDNDIRITIHTFPWSHLQERIPPLFQIERWKQQLFPISFASTKIIPVSYGGFVGFHFEATGMIEEKPTSILAWAMQLSDEHIGDLAGYYQQAAADYTIKAVGSPELIQQHRQRIILFANSFELIQEIP